MTYQVYRLTSRCTDGTSVTVRSGSTQLATDKLNNAVTVLQIWLENWRININLSKCSIIIFSKRRSHYSVNLPQLSSFIHPLIGQVRSNTWGYPRLHTDYKHHINKPQAGTDLSYRQCSPPQLTWPCPHLTTHQSPLRSALRHAAYSHFNTHQIFQSNLLAIISELPQVKPTDALHTTNKLLCKL